jgi:hypothetical protein
MRKPFKVGSLNVHSFVGKTSDLCKTLPPHRSYMTVFVDWRDFK